MKKINGFSLFILVSLIPYFGLSQTAINTDGSDAHSSAMLDVKSNSKGVLIPRLTQSEIESIESPANSLTVFNTDDDKFYTYILAENVWKEIAFGPGSIQGQFICGTLLEDARDGQSYATVQIGDQCWMAESLNIGTMINASQEMSDDGIIERYCYDDNTANCDEYGGLYQWDEMMQYNNVPGKQGICPDGWHLPTDIEWYVLEYFVDPTIPLTTGWRGIDGGGKLKEAGTTHWQSPNTGATNSSGFTALPGGFRDTNGDCSYLTSSAGWWSSTEYSSSSAWVRSLQNNYAQAYRSYNIGDYGFSVRCLLD